jgi:3-oxoadipate enol-lactonase
MPTLHLDDIALHYEEHGSGVPVVLCHEFAQNHTGWAAQVSHLARNYRVVTFSRRGYPPSDVPSVADDYAFARQITDMAALCSYLSLQPAHLIGHGAGGNIALSYGLQQPDALLSLVLAGAGAGSTQPDAWKADNAIFANEIELGGLDALVGAIGNAPQRQAFRRKDPTGWAKFEAQMRQLSPEGAARSMRGAFTRPGFFEMADQLAGFEVPTLLLLGDQDEPSFVPSRFVFETAPCAEMAVMPGCGHTENLENPALFNQLVCDFLRRHSQPRHQRAPSGS